MVRYTLLRFLIFFGCLALLWLLGLRSRGDELFLVVGAALLSLGISYVVLRPFREEASAQLANKVDTRRARRARTTSPIEADIAAEDAEDEDVRPAPREGQADDFR